MPRPPAPRALPLLLLLAVLATPAPGQAPTDALVHWHLNELGGAQAQDRAAGHDGLVLGAQPVDGPSGNARRFDGVDDRIDLPPAALGAVGGLSEGSLAVWFRFEPFGPDGFMHPIVYLGIDDTAKPDDMLVVEVGHRGAGDANRRLYITWVADGVPPLCFDSGFDLAPDTWYHFVATVGPQGNTGYLDGVELVDRHYNFGDASMQLFLADVAVQDVFRVGWGKSADPQSPEFLHLDGAVDELMVFDRALTAGEVAALHAAQRDALLAADDYDLVSFEGGSVTLLLDGGPALAGRPRLLLCGLSGSAPGTTLPGPTQTVLPLNVDPLTELVIATLGAPLWEDFAGTLGPAGRDTAALHLPPLPPGTAGTFTFAWAVKPWTVASNPIDVQLEP